MGKKVVEDFLYKEDISVNQRTHQRQSASINSGFTLVELIVVIGIITLVSAMAVLYSRAGEQVITLYQEQIKILNTLSRAKSLSINTFVEPREIAPCGFGVYFDGANNSFIIFRETASQLNCSDMDFQRAGDGSEDIENFKLSPAIVFDNLSVSNIIFSPPEPLTFILPGFQNEAVIKIKISGTDKSRSVKITRAGMIAAQ